MTKSELIERLAAQRSHIPAKTAEDAVEEMPEYMALAPTQGERIETRGFGNSSSHCHVSHTGRNPRAGDRVELKGKCVPYFKPSKELRGRADIYG